MALRRLQVDTEWHPANEGPTGFFYLGEVTERLEALLPEWEGKIKLIYMDPVSYTHLLETAGRGLHDIQDKIGSAVDDA